MENRWMTWGVAAVLVLQIYSLMQMSDLRQAGQQVGDLHLQISQLSNRINSLDNQLNMMARASEWVQNPRIEVNAAPGCGQANVTADWTLKEVEPGARVEFLYRSRAEQEWHTVEATATGGGSYRAGFPVTGSVTASPAISVESPTGKGGMGMTTEFGAEPRYQYEYRIAATSAGQTRSSEPQQLDVGKAFFSWFQLAAMVRPDGYRVTLTHGQKPDESPCTAVTGARVRGMIGDRVVLESPLQAENAERMWAELATKEQLDRLDVVVKYGAGNEQTHSVKLR